MYQQNIPSFGGTTSTYYSYSTPPQPSAHITKSRGRLKTYGDKVYLKDGSSFEIELFNPKTTSVLAKIWINGSPLSDSGIILKPGQRVYLERFIDVAKKFKFETYEVESGSPEVEAAIANNGKVQVYFYDETQAPDVRLKSNFPWYGGLTYVNSNNSGSITLANSVGNSTLTAYCSTDTVGNQISSGVVSSLVQETGRIESGSASSQELVSSYGTFSSWTCASVFWQILPESKKPVEAGEIRSYCTNCGTRHKKSSWKFCPNCGTQIIS